MNKLGINYNNCSGYNQIYAGNPDAGFSGTSSQIRDWKGEEESFKFLVPKVYLGNADSLFINFNS